VGKIKLGLTFCDYRVETISSDLKYKQHQMAGKYIIVRNIFLAGTFLGTIGASKAQKIILSNVQSGAISPDILRYFHDDYSINYNTGNSDITNRYQFLKVMVQKGILKMEDWTERSVPTNRGH
jgi:hypothetical protein